LAAAQQERQAEAAPSAESIEEGIECETTCSAEAFSIQQTDDEAKLDRYKAGAVGAGLAAIVAGLNSEWVASHEELALVSVFFLGYLGIIIEEELAFNKAGVALILAVVLWTIRSAAGREGLKGGERALSLPASAVPLPGRTQALQSGLLLVQAAAHSA